MALPADTGGATFLELALLCELAGRTLASTPLIESLVCLRALTRVRATSPQPAVDEVIDELASGTVGTLALRPTSGGSQIAPAGGVASIVLAAVDGTLVLARAADQRVRRYVRVHGPTPLASWDLTPRPGDVTVQGVNGDDVVHVAVDEWKVLTAAALMGLARRAVEIGADYATTRRAFGTPIGAFQGVAHPLADAATDIDGGTLLARRAAWLVDVGDRREAARLACLAWGFCGPVATRATAHAVHIHGGYGAALEYDIQLFHRRARAWSTMLGDPREQLRVVGDALLAERRQASGPVG